MSNIITLPTRSKPASTAHYEEIALYGHAGPLIVSLARRTDEPTGLIHVVLLGASVGLEIVASLPDDEKGRAVADFVGPAVLRTAELVETELAAQPEAC
ncbi:MAG: hypothetical protein EKK50_13515 [Sphingomonadaceae bacterium]|uniref:hypothetical protein n=1 Tax=Methylobacterium oryzae TaxID=334852 RepID=UPI000FB7AA83|nr:hypothetical protein [Methylobacterium oryzae]RTL15255.1 MAG: hypothetical protein EKK50_13515 [Sphingomonadaceae bacterium]UIN35158.1 hypothetical protein LXM90_01245 [Methylobacterium oryzae]